jgi:ankyrin repeat protein
MENLKVYRELYAAAESGNTKVVRKLLTSHPELRKEVNELLGEATRENNVDLMSVLVEFGADINAPEAHNLPEGVIYRAAGNGAVDAVRWLLEHGAKVNFELKDFPGESRCFPLTSAVQGNHIEIVKLLVEKGGANINAHWGGFTPLSYAIMYNKKEIEKYLRSKGAMEPKDLKGKKTADKAKSKKKKK